MAGDSVEFLVDIAARMAGGDATISQLADMADKLSNAGGSVATLEKALSQANAAMEKTGAAAAAASADLATEQQRYDELQKAADSAAKALEKAGAATKGAVPIDLKQKADAASAALKAEAGALDKAKKSAAEAAAAHAKATGTVKHLTDATKQAVAAQTSFGDKLKNVGKWAAAGLASVAALGGGIAALGLAAIGAHDENALLQAKLDALAGGSVGGWRAKQAIEDIATQAGITDDQLQPMAQQLLAIGTPIDELRSKLKALTAQQALGLGGDQALADMFARLAEGAKIGEKQLLGLTKATGVTQAAIAGKLGMSLKDFKAKLKDGTLDSKKLGDALVELSTAKGMDAMKVRAESFDQKMKNLKDSVGDMLGESIKTGPAMEAFNKFGALFDKNTASGQAMRKSLSTMFEALGTAATKAAPIVVAAIEKMSHAISGLIDFMSNPSLTSLAMIGEKQTKKLDVGDTSDIKGDATQKLIALEEKLAALRAKSKAEMGLLGPSEEAIAQEEMLKGEISQVKKELDAASKGADGAGKSVADGYAAGIRAGMPGVMAAAALMATQAQVALALADQSHSPSRKYEKLGTFVGQGYAGGIENTQPMVRSALGRMTGSVAPTGGPVASGGAAGKRLSLTGPFYFYGVRDAEDAESRFEAMLTRTLEGDASQLGAGQEPPP